MSFLNLGLIHTCWNALNNKFDRLKWTELNKRKNMRVQIQALLFFFNPNLKLA